MMIIAIIIKALYQMFYKIKCYLKVNVPCPLLADEETKLQRTELGPKEIAGK